jgi:hypothetical protein
MIILVVNKNRYLINDKSVVADEVCSKILKQYPSDAEVYFDEVKLTDVI